MNAQGDTRVDVLVDYWKAQGLVPSTIRRYRQTLAAAGGLDATGEQLRAYLAAYSNPGTRAQKRMVLRTSFPLAVALGLIDSDPSRLLGKVRVPRRLPRPLTAAELALLESQAREPIRTYVTLAAYAGLRASEIARASFADLETYPGGWRLRVVGKAGHVAVVPAHAKVVAALADFRPSPKLTGNYVSKMCLVEFRRLGIPGGIHRARHSFATRCLAVSHDLLVVRDLMRHASIATTQIYTALDADAPALVVAGL